MKRLFFIIAVFCTAAFSQARPVRVWISASDMVPLESYSFYLDFRAVDSPAVFSDVFNVVASESGNALRAYVFDWDDALLTSFYLDYASSANGGEAYGWVTDTCLLNQTRVYYLDGFPITVSIEPIPNETNSPSFDSLLERLKVIVGILLFIGLLIGAGWFKK